ncbi:MAG: hypothetical protein LBK60_04925 [Verrucomicrobiales bacterium]|jgi:hypothetical protein|nr:hypothetical protein [Verrucomicrobiales bacterium]
MGLIGAGMMLVNVSVYADQTWTGIADNDWFNSSNWVGSGDIYYINNVTANAPVFNSGTLSVNALRVSDGTGFGVLTISGGTLAVNEGNDRLVVLGNGGGNPACSTCRAPATCTWKPAAAGMALACWSAT